VLPHGARRDPEHPCDLGIGQSLGDQLENLALAGSTPPPRSTATGADGDERRRCDGTASDLGARDRALRGRSLENADPAGRTRAERAPHREDRAIGARCPRPRAGAPAPGTDRSGELPRRKEVRVQPRTVGRCQRICMPVPAAGLAYPPEPRASASRAMPISSRTSACGLKTRGVGSGRRGVDLYARSARAAAARSRTSGRPCFTRDASRSPARETPSACTA